MPIHLDYLVCITGAVEYTLDLPALYGGVHPTFYVSRLLAHQSIGGEGTDPGVGPGPVTVDGEEKYQVERIVAQHRHGGLHHFLV